MLPSAETGAYLKEISLKNEFTISSEDFENNKKQTKNTSIFSDQTLVQILKTKLKSKFL
jgi:hypothetical protein